MTYVLSKGNNLPEILKHT